MRRMAAGGLDTALWPGILDRRRPAPEQPDAPERSAALVV